MSVMSILLKNTANFARNLARAFSSKYVLIPKVQVAHNEVKG